MRSEECRGSKLPNIYNCVADPTLVSGDWHLIYLQSQFFVPKKATENRGFSVF